VTTSGGNTFGCLPKAEDRDWPASTAARTSPRVFARALFSVCSDRIDNARMSDRPLLIIVANWRLITARSLILTRLPPGSESSRLMPLFASRTVMGAKPIATSFCTSAASLGASSLPPTSLPRRSRTEYSNVFVAVVMTPSLRPCRRAG